MTWEEIKEKRKKNNPRTWEEIKTSRGYKPPIETATGTELARIEHLERIKDVKQKGGSLLPKPAISKVTDPLISNPFSTDFNPLTPETIDYINNMKPEDRPRYVPTVSSDEKPTLQSEYYYRNPNLVQDAISNPDKTLWDDVKDVYTKANASVGAGIADTGAGLLNFIRKVYEHNRRDTTRLNDNVLDSALSGATGKELLKLSTQPVYRDKPENFIEKGLLKGVEAFEKRGSEFAEPIKDLEGAEKIFYGGVRAVPQTATALASGPLAPVVLGGTAFGGSAREAELAGAPLGEQMEYASLNALVELGTELLPLSKMKNILKGSKTPVREMAVSAVEEFFGEGISEALSPHIKRATYDEDAELATWKQIIEAGLTGSVSAMMISGVSMKIASAERAVANGDYSPETIESIRQDIEETTGVNIKPIDPQTNVQDTNMPNQQEKPNLIPDVRPNIEKPSLLPNVKPQAKNVSLVPDVKPQAKSNLIPDVKPTTKNKNIIPAGEVQSAKPRKFMENSMLNSDIVPDVMKVDTQKNIESETKGYVYEPISNHETLDQAQAEINNNSNALYDFLTLNTLRSAKDTATGEDLIRRAINAGDYKTANNVSVRLAELLTNAGQTVQAAAMMKKLTPEGMLQYANKQISRMQEKTKGKVELSDEETKFILDSMKEIQNMEDGRKKDIEIAKVMKIINDKVPPSKTDSFAALQRISMLLNAKTQVRNVVGNSLMAGLEVAKEAPRRGIDALIGLKTKERTSTGYKRKDLLAGLQGFKKGGQEALEDYKLGINTRTSKGQFDIEKGKSFTEKTIVGKSLNKVDNLVSFILSVGDRPFSNMAYEMEKSRLSRVEKYKNNSQLLEETAHDIAEERTFQNKSWLAENATKGRNKLGIAGRIIMPFSYTPSNITDKIFDYTPLGGIRTITQNFYKDIRNGNFDQRKTSERLSRHLTGSAMIMLGWYLAKAGIIRGAYSDDPDKRAMEKQIGVQDYSFIMGDRNVTFDWAQPFAVPLAIGANIYDNINDEGRAEQYVFNAVQKSIIESAEILVEQPLLTGIRKLFGGYGSDGIIGNAVNIAKNAPSQLIPGLSLARQVRQISDPLQRQIDYSDPLQTLRNQLPGLSQELPVKYDTLGNPVKYSNNPFDALLNPSSSTKIQPSRIEQEILDVYDVVGDKGIFPKVSPKTVQYNNVSYTLTQEEKSKMQNIMGETTNEYLTKIMSNSQYNSLTNEEKNAIIKGVIEDAYNLAKLEIVKGRE